MKLLLSKLVLPGVLIAGILVCSVKAQPGVTRPPGVPMENWIAISDSVGIVVATVPPAPTLYRFDPDQPGGPPGPNAIPLGNRSLRGVLMAKQNGLWNRVDLELPPAQTRLLDH